MLKSIRMRRNIISTLRLLIHHRYRYLIASICSSIVIASHAFYLWLLFSHTLPEYFQLHGMIRETLDQVPPELHIEFPLLMDTNNHIVADIVLMNSNSHHVDDLDDPDPIEISFPFISNSKASSSSPHLVIDIPGKSGKSKNGKSKNFRTKNALKHKNILATVSTVGLTVPRIDWDSPSSVSLALADVFSAMGLQIQHDALLLDGHEPSSQTLLHLLWSDLMPGLELVLESVCERNTHNRVYQCSRATLDRAFDQSHASGSLASVERKLIHVIHVAFAIVAVWFSTAVYWLELMKITLTLVVFKMILDRLGGSSNSNHSSLSWIDIGVLMIHLNIVIQWPYILHLCGHLHLHKALASESVDIRGNLLLFDLDDDPLQLWRLEASSAVHVALALATLVLTSIIGYSSTLSHNLKLYSPVVHVHNNGAPENENPPIIQTSATTASLQWHYYLEHARHMRYDFELMRVSSSTRHILSVENCRSALICNLEPNTKYRCFGIASTTDDDAHVCGYRRYFLASQEFEFSTLSEDSEGSQSRVMAQFFASLHQQS